MAATLDRYTLSLDAKTRDWVLKPDGGARAVKRSPKKADAITDLSERFGNSDGASVKIQKMDGTIQEERTYPRSMDPRKSRG